MSLAVVDAVPGPAIAVAAAGRLLHENQGEGVRACDPECCTCFASGSRHL